MQGITNAKDAQQASQRIMEWAFQESYKGMHAQGWPIVRGDGNKASYYVMKDDGTVLIDPIGLLSDHPSEMDSGLNVHCHLTNYTYLFKAEIREFWTEVKAYAGPAYNFKKFLAELQLIHDLAASGEDLRKGFESLAKMHGIQLPEVA